VTSDVGWRVANGSRSLGLQMAKRWAKWAQGGDQRPQRQLTARNKKTPGKQGLCCGVRSARPTAFPPWLTKSSPSARSTSWSTTPAQHGAHRRDYPDEAWHKVMNLNVNAPFSSRRSRQALHDSRKREQIILA
jgi:gluconate 5-dehydrogenase